MYPPWNENTSGDWREEDLVISFPGTTLERRLELVSEWIKKVII
jgi:hypothetical protein